MPLKPLQTIANILPIVSFVGVSSGICYALGLFFIIDLKLFILLSIEDFLKFSIVGMLFTFLGMLSGVLKDRISNVIVKKNENKSLSFTIRDGFFWGWWIGTFLILGKHFYTNGYPFTGILMGGFFVWIGIVTIGTLLLAKNSDNEEFYAYFSLILFLSIMFGVMKGESFIHAKSDKYAIKTLNEIIDASDIQIISKGVIYFNKGKPIFLHENNIYAITQIEHY